MTARRSSPRARTAGPAAGSAAAAAEMERDDVFTAIGEETMGGEDDLQLDDVEDLGGDLDDDL